MRRCCVSARCAFSLPPDRILSRPDYAHSWKSEQINFHFVCSLCISSFLASVFFFFFLVYFFNLTLDRIEDGKADCGTHATHLNVYFSNVPRCLTCNYINKQTHSNVCRNLFIFISFVWICFSLSRRSFIRLCAAVGVATFYGNLTSFVARCRIHEAIEFCILA